MRSGTHGGVERNTMRSCLAIEAYLQTLGAPPAELQNMRIEKWCDSAKQYPLQLHETDKARYLAMKSDEI